MFRYLAAAAMLIAPAAALRIRDASTLTQTAFAARDKTAALAQLASVEAAAAATLARAPGDTEAQMTRAMAVSYRAKLSQSRTDALAAKAQFEALAAKNPRDAEAQAALGAWHLNAVEALGGFARRAPLWVRARRRPGGARPVDRARRRAGAVPGAGRVAASGDRPDRTPPPPPCSMQRSGAPPRPRSTA